MKFSSKLSLGSILLLTAGLSFSGLALIGCSFAGSLHGARTALQARQTKEVHALERLILSDTGYNARADRNYLLATYARQFAASAQDDSRLCLWSGDNLAVYNDLPLTVNTALQKEYAAAGADAWRIVPDSGQYYLVLSQPMNLLGQRADLLCAYDISYLFATRLTQLRLWAGITLLLLAAGSAAAVWFSRKLTAPLSLLQTASGQIAAGDYTRRTALATGDELAALSASFDAMAQAVEDKIAAMDDTVQRQKDFIAAFTHEIKTPMTAMLGYADLMRAMPGDTELQQESAAYIYHETQRLELLSRRLLALLGLDAEDALQPEAVTDAELFALVLRSLPKDAQPLPAVQSCGCTVQVDPSLWSDLLRNLVLNAQKACRGKQGSAVFLRCCVQNGQAVFTVTDTGCGIPAKDLPRVTEAFYMVDKSRARAAGGSGIGLALCARIAAAHGATLHIASTEGQGTTVTAAVPVYKEVPAHEG